MAALQSSRARKHHEESFASSVKTALRWLRCHGANESIFSFPNLPATPVNRSRKTSARYRHLLRYVQRHRLGWLLLAFATLCYVPFALLQPWPMKLLVDNVLGAAPLPAQIARVLSPLPGTQSTPGLLAWVVAASFLVFLVNTLFDVVVTFGWVRVGQRMVYDFALDLFSDVQRRSMVFHTRNSVGDLMARITYDTWCVHTIMDMLLLKPLTIFFSMGSMIAVMARIDGGLTLLSLAVAPFMAGSSLLLARPG